mgnify:CR=1 FL=1
MNSYSKKDILKSLKKLGIKKGDTIFINPEIYKFGVYKNAVNNDDYFNDFYFIIKNLIGRNGTLCMNTYTFDTLRKNQPFNYDSHKCTSGKLSEILLKDKKSVRSIHPVFSVSAVGKLANYICKSNSSHNYGYNSPYLKFMNCDGKIINLGMNPWQTPFSHVSEFLVGVPYYYNKFTKVKYFKNKISKKLSFSSFVRYLNFDLIEDYTQLKKKMKKNNLIKTQKLGDGFMYSVNVNEYVKTCIQLLSKDQFCLINKKSYLKSLKAK